MLVNKAISIFISKWNYISECNKVLNLTTISLLGETFK